MTGGSVHGYAEERFAPLREMFEENVTSGAELGASVCVTVEGNTVVDLWGGFADKARTRPWERDTIVNVYSVTKTMTAMTALLLADRGELDFAAPVARYWPEFAANGKGKVTVAHLMSHSSGVAGWTEPVTQEDLYDWEKSTAMLAAQAPFWEPGTASGYHSTSQGHLIGEVVRRITGRTVGTVFREEFAEPLNADFFIGLPESEEDRVAQLVPPTDEIDLDATEYRRRSAYPSIDRDAPASRAWRAAEIPAGNGHGNARSIAEIHRVLANGGAAAGRRFMSEAGCRKALEVQTDGRDLVLDMPVRWGLGYAVGGQFMPSPNSLYWGGFGGSLAIIDLDVRTTFGYAMNRMGGGTTGSMRGFGLAMAMWTAQGLL
jgi:CubicO group peptidase (beta-lactamase class C family)